MRSHSQLPLIVFGFSVAVAACGGGGSGGGSGDGRQDSGVTPEQRSQYDGLGFRPAALPRGLSVPADPIDDAIAPGYLALSALVASTDFRGSTENLGWFIPGLLAGTVERAGCSVEQNVVSHADADGDAHADLGERIAFRYDDCVPAGGMLTLTEASPDVEPHEFEGDDSHQRSLFKFNRLVMETYNGLVFRTNGWLTRFYHPERVACPDALSGEAFVDCEQMSFTNLERTGSWGTLEVAAAAGQPVLTLWGSDDGAQPGEIRTLVNQSDHGLLVNVEPALSLRLDSLDPGRSGTYILRTLDAGLRLCHTTSTFVRAAFHICAGGFSVEDPSGAVFTFEAVNGADPVSVADLRVTVDPDGEGAAPAEQGYLPQAFITQRLNLAN